MSFIMKTLYLQQIEKHASVSAAGTAEQRSPCRAASCQGYFPSQQWQVSVLKCFEGGGK